MRLKKNNVIKTVWRHLDVTSWWSNTIYRIFLQSKGVSFCNNHKNFWKDSLINKEVIPILKRSTFFETPCISQLIRFARVSNHVTDFNTRNLSLTATLLYQGYRYHELKKAFSKCHRRHYELVSKFNFWLNRLLLQEVSQPEVNGDIIYTCT